MTRTTRHRGQLKMTNLHLVERQVDPPNLLVQILCPFRNDDFHYDFSG